MAIDDSRIVAMVGNRGVDQRCGYCVDCGVIIQSSGRQLAFVTHHLGYDESNLGYEVMTGG